MAKYNFKQLENIWTKNGGDKKLAPIMAAIALAESGGRTTAHHTNSDGTVDQGLWQINSSNYRLYKGKNIYGVNENAHVAIRLANHGKGLGNWTTYTSGAYKKHIPKGTHIAAGVLGASTGNKGGGGGVTGDIVSGAKDVASVVTNPGGAIVSGAGSVFHDITGGVGGAIASPVESALSWFGMRIVFALIIMGGAGLILLGLLLIGADLGLSAFSGALGSGATRKAGSIAERVTPAGRLARKTRATKAARATEIHGQRVRMGEAKVKTEQARATELRTRTRHRAALAKQSKAASERTKREAYYQGAADAASPTMAKIRKQRKGKKAA